MNPQAQVDSIEVIKAFRESLLKFIDSAGSALSDTDADIHRTQVWLEREQKSHWQGQLQKRTQKVAQAKDALRRKKLYKTAAGTTPAADEEEKALQIAERQLAEARLKVGKVSRWRRELEKEAYVRLTIMSPDPAAALRHLGEALKRGFLVEELDSEELDRLRELKGFKELVEEYER